MTDDFVFSDTTDKDTSEFLIHRAIMDHMAGQRRVGNKVYKGSRPFPDVFITTIFQGRSEEDGVFLKMLGVVPGMSDIIAFYPHMHRGQHPDLLFGCSLLEVKRPKNGSQSFHQKTIEGKCGVLGMKYVIVKSVRDVHNHFIRQGLKPFHNAIQEPDTRTKSQKFQEHFDAFKPRD